MLTQSTLARQLHELSALKSSWLIHGALPGSVSYVDLMLVLSSATYAVHTAEAFNGVHSHAHESHRIFPPFSSIRMVDCSKHLLPLKLCYPSAHFFFDGNIVEKNFDHCRKLWKRWAWAHAFRFAYFRQACGVRPFAKWYFTTWFHWRYQKALW